MTERDSRYAQKQDAAPPRPIAAHEVLDAVPRPDPLLAVGNTSPYTVNGVTYEVLEDHRGYTEEGIASWYGTKFNGYETSNGEIFDLYQPSAAHKTLPIPSYARVTNIENGASVVVRVNDRGPFHADRLIDLSYAAAVKLGFMQQGTARVRVELIDLDGVDDRRRVPLGSYRFLQVGAFGSESSAQRLQVELQALVAAPVAVSPVDTVTGRLYRVRIGPMQDVAQMETVQQTLRNIGYEPGQPLP
ncbi:MAG: septal ring lytic transglycosylase RlpA family protein [Halioglobus sp.]